ncbi:MAG: TolC family protein [Lacipirellulaceae bacterium]
MPVALRPSTNRQRRGAIRPLAVGCCAVLAAVGCSQRGGKPFAPHGNASAGPDPYVIQATSLDYAATSQATEQALADSALSLAPRTLADGAPASYRDAPLEEVIRLGLENAPVLRDAGGAVVRSPDATRTVYDPAIRETDPGVGVEAALSAFDAQFTTSLFNEKNDRALNNEFFGGGTRLLTQDSSVSQTQLAKRSVTGTEMALRQVIEFDSNNAPGNLFDSAWTTKYEGEVRQPLLQGAGLEYNRIAGPTNVPGVAGGVLLARVNADVELADFELAVRDYVSNLENAYWDLYFAYRDLAARVAARDAALDTWRRVRALYESGRRGGEAEKEAQAREQYFRFQEEVQNALSGRPVDSTQVANGSPGGTFRGAGGVLVAERRLRRLMGLPASDGALLRPTADPVVAKIAFDWDDVSAEAMGRRAELRRQRWKVRRRELELVASKNHLLPRLDAVGRYRFRGFGDDLLDSGGNGARFDDAYGDLTSGDFQEWQLGFELDVPIGYRRAHSAVRNSELLLSRERALLADQQAGVVHQVAEAVAELDRAYEVSQTAYNRLVATKEQLEATRAAFEADKAPLDLFLEAQRMLAEAESRYYRALVEHAVALKNVHFTKGTLLDFDGVRLAEGPWVSDAYADAAERAARRGKPRPLNYASSRAPRLSAGPVSQGSMSAGASVIDPPAATPATTVPSSGVPAGPQQPLPPKDEPVEASPTLLRPVSAAEPVGSRGMIRPLGHVEPAEASPRRLPSPR